MKEKKFRYSSWIPATFRVSRRGEILWGRLTRLNPGELKFISNFEIEPGKTATLAFEFSNSEFENIQVKIRKRARDKSGYFIYECRFLETGEVSELKKEIFNAIAGPRKSMKEKR